MYPMEFPAGVTTLLSRAAHISNWRDGNLVRWDDGMTLRPVGGWEAVPLGSGVAPVAVTYNPSDKSAGVTLSNGNLTATASTSTDMAVRATQSFTVGKHYFEVTIGTTYAGGDTGFGIATSTAPLGTVGTNATSALLTYPAGTTYYNGSIYGNTTGALGSGHVVAVAIDLDNRRAWFANISTGGQWNGSPANNPATNVGGIDISSVFNSSTPAYPCQTFNSSGSFATANFGATAFSGTVPSGFLAWNNTGTASAFASRCRAMHRWIALDNTLWTAYLCEQHCYVSSGGGLIDVTPAAGMLPPAGDTAGYGELSYGTGAYGVHRTGISTIQKFSNAWSLSNWGQNLLFMASYDGLLYQWSPSSPPGTRGAVVTGAPINNRQFVVTPERHVMLFQLGGNEADFGWCSQENINDWDFASITNTAGKYTLDPYSPIVAAQVSDSGITVHTPAMSYFVDYVGLPYIYRRRPMGEVPIPISASAIAAIPEGVIWASVEGFWLFNGSVADIIPCPLWDSITKQMDFGRTIREAVIVHMHNRGEIWWFWVDPTINLYANRYVALDYRSKVWMPGYLQRTCGLTFGNDRSPVMSDGTNVWKHETGFVYPNALHMPYLESQTLNFQGGESWITVNKILPDVMGDVTALAFSLAVNTDRTMYSTQRYTTPRPRNGYGWVDIRETGRDIRLRIDMVKNADWSTIGPIIFDLKKRGKK